MAIQVIKNKTPLRYVKGCATSTSSSIQIIDNLSSTSPSAALSANQGRALDERLTIVENEAHLDFQTLSTLP